MKKLFALALAACMVLSLAACTVQTPAGELTVGFDSTKKSQDTRIIDEDGNETVIDADKVSSLVDQLLGTVALPNGATTAELKSFIYDTLGVVGIDLDNLDDVDMSEVEEEVKGAIDEWVEENGGEVVETPAE